MKFLVRSLAWRIYIFPSPWQPAFDESNPLAWETSVFPTITFHSIWRKLLHNEADTIPTEYQKMIWYPMSFWYSFFLHYFLRILIWLHNPMKVVSRNTMRFLLDSLDYIRMLSFAFIGYGMICMMDMCWDYYWHGQNILRVEFLKYKICGSPFLLQFQIVHPFSDGVYTVLGFESSLFQSQVLDAKWVKQPINPHQQSKIPN